MTRAHAPGLLALAAGAGVAVEDGGLAGTTWPVLGAVLLAVLLVAALTGPRPPIPAPVRLALGALAALCAIAYLSILWADVPADALSEAGRTAVYALAVLAVALAPWPPRALRAALAIVAVGGTALAVVVLVRSAVLDDPSGMFVVGRLSDPIRYANANAGLWLIAFWCATGLALDRALPWPPRAGAAAASCLLLEVSLLSQSRGALAAVVLTAIVVVALARERLALIAHLGLIAAAAALASGALLDVRDAASLEAALSGARWAVLASVAGVALVVSVGHAATRRGSGASPRWDRFVRRAERLAGPAVAVGATVAALVAVGNPIGWADDRWTDFRSGSYERVESGPNRFTGGLGSHRHDYYRVALHEFREHPLAGIGAGNFQVPYLAQRESIDAPRYPHSLPLQLLSQLGLAGALAFVLFLTPLLLLGVRAARARAPDAVLALAAMGAFGVWALHGLTDWIWEFPALSLTALGLLMVAARATPAAPGDASDTAPRRWAWAIAATPVAAGLVASFVVVGVSATRAAEGRDHAQEDPARALRAYARAADANPLDADVLVEEAILARRLGDTGHARRALERAIDREPRHWFARLELAMLLGAPRDKAPPADRRRAAAEVRTARELNPRQVIIGEVRALLDRRYRIDPAAVEAKLERRPDRDPAAVDR